MLTVNATPEKVRIFDGANIIAQHERSNDKGKQVELESHSYCLSYHFYQITRIQTRSATPRFSHDLLNTSNGVL